MTQGRRIILTLGESRVVGTERDSDKEGYFAVLADGAIGAPSLFSVYDGWTAQYPVEVPTKPYAVVVPPQDSEEFDHPFVLEPVDKATNDYRLYRSGGTGSIGVSEITDKLANGWRVVFAGVGG